MDSLQQRAIVLDILNFAGREGASALADDIGSLGYRNRVKCGRRWLGGQNSVGGAEVVLLGKNPLADDHCVEIVERMGDTSWVCVLGGRGNDRARGFMRAATEFLQAPWSLDELAVRLERFTSQIVNAKRRLAEGLAETGIVGTNPTFRAILMTAERIAPSLAPVIIEGETGTGKELVAQLIHRLSSRKKAFVAVNCGCLPPDLVENELFGHEAGAFTGASTARAGLVQQADGGTLFLDEIDALSMRAQIALLRFLQEGEVRPVGGGALRRVSVRVVAASNVPLEDLVTAGRFREDLYFRLNVLGLALPPLRERRDDIVELTRFFLDKHTANYGRDPLSMSEGAMAWLMSHELRGNVRQLEHLVHRAVLSASGTNIALTDIAPAGTPEPEVIGTGIEPFAAAKARTIRAFERRYLTELMQETGGNVTAAAARAQKERRALGRLLKKYEIGPSWDGRLG